MRHNDTNQRKEETMREKIEQLKAELEQSGSEQYKAAIRSQIRRLEYYLLNGHWPK